MSKKCFLSAWEILGFARFLAGFCHLALLCRSCKRYKNFSFATHLLQSFLSPSITHRPHHSCNRAKYLQDAPQQKLSILLFEPCHSTICRHISSFDKISIKCSKKCGMLATLVKFNQASDPHPPRQQKFVKKHSIHTA